MWHAVLIAIYSIGPFLMLLLLSFQEKKEEKGLKEEFLFGTAAELKLDPSQRKPVIVNVDTDELAHPNVRVDS